MRSVNMVSLVIEKILFSSSLWFTVSYAADRSTKMYSECTLNVSIKPGKARFEQNIQMGVFVNDIKVKNTQMRTEELSVDKMLDAYNNTLSIPLNKHAPLKKTRVKTQPHPGYNEDIKDAGLYRRVCERIWRPDYNVPG